MKLVLGESLGQQILEEQVIEPLELLALLKILGGHNTAVALEVVIGRDGPTFTVGRGDGQADEPAAAIWDSGFRAQAGLRAFRVGDHQVKNFGIEKIARQRGSQYWAECFFVPDRDSGSRV